MTERCGTVVSYILTWPPMRVAQELYRHARDNAALRQRVFELEHELFWMKAVERERKEKPDD